MKFEDIRGVICDMDGVLWRGSEPLPGMADFFQLMQDAAMPYMLASNNSSRSPAQYVQKINGMGVDSVREENIVNSGLATANFLTREYPIGADVHVVGGDGLRQVITDAGFPLVDDGAEVVVVGLEFNITYEHLRRAALQIRAGARFIGTNPDPSFPSPEGLIPGTGSILAALETATDQKAEVIGKPYAPMFEYALDRLGTDPAHTLMIGDRISTDIAGAVALGMKTAMVFTGVNTPDDLVQSDVQPDVAYEDMPALLKAWNYQGGKRRR